MRVKKFTGKTMQEAVESLRRDFGNDAVILHTKQKRSWLLGRIGPKRFEVVGAIDPNLNRQTKESTANRKPSNVTVSTERIKKIESPSMANADPGWSDTIQTLFGRLVSLDIPKDLAQSLIKKVLAQIPKEQWNDTDRIWTELCTVISQTLTTVDPWDFADEQKIVVLMGPTGVGKTTTVAKLAANFSLVAGRKVGVITVDTYRIAAVEQLKTYAEIIGIPVQVAYSPQELKDAIKNMPDRELILVDTVGRSQNNHIHMAELKNYLDGIDAEIHLVVSATTKNRDIDEIIRVFGQLPIDRVIVTKLDETSAHGVILYTCERANAPLAFVTTGQGVPEDIDVASSEKLARLILGDWA